MLSTACFIGHLLPFSVNQSVCFVHLICQCVTVFVLVCHEAGRVLEQGNGEQQEEDPYMDEFVKENGSDCGTCRHFERALEGSQRN